MERAAAPVATPARPAARAAAPVKVTAVPTVTTGPLHVVAATESPLLSLGPLVAEAMPVLGWYQVTWSCPKPSYSPV